MLSAAPQEVADCVNRWLGVDAAGTAENSWTMRTAMRVWEEGNTQQRSQSRTVCVTLLKTPNSRAMVALTGICCAENICAAEPFAPLAQELASL